MINRPDIIARVYQVDGNIIYYEKRVDGLWVGVLKKHIADFALNYKVDEGER